MEIFIATYEDQITVHKYLEAWASNIKEIYGINDYDVDEILEIAIDAWDEGEYGIVMAEGDIPVRLYRVKDL
jgi:hypothetical protein